MARKYIAKRFCPQIMPQWDELIDILTPIQSQELWRAVCRFPNYEPADCPIWGFIKSQLQDQMTEFLGICNAKAQASRDYWNNKGEQKVSNGNQMDTTRLPNGNHKINRGNLKSPSPSPSESKPLEPSNEGSSPLVAANKKFTPPTVEQVAEYCRERNNNIDAEGFVVFYRSKGWKIGNSPMKDWKSAVVVWEKRNKRDLGGVATGGIVPSKQDIATARNQIKIEQETAWLLEQQKQREAKND